MEEEMEKSKEVKELKLGKELLEKQLLTAKEQMEDNKKLYDSLKVAIDKTSAKHNAEDLQDQVHILEVNKVYY